MASKRTLRKENAHSLPASRLPVPARNHKTLTAVASSQPGKIKIVANEEEVPQTELEKLDSLRTQLEQSLDEFIRARKKLEEIIPAEGSGEQERLPIGSNADLRTELKRHRELAPRVASSLKGKENPNNRSQGQNKLHVPQWRETALTFKPSLS
ncbi:uncharacterized protein itgb3bp isoform X1 [Solea solea]|uniref:uncharacterized protein itgb3bp isoform X1 n=1 Tax=Solea solea TaxID=90069 RepID=UPI002729FEF9|nr:uncharacterized protein itgb3bp isoform X1 [Solea solea]